jgi:hypothetical protein
MCIDCLYAEFEPDPARECRVVEADMIFTRRDGAEVITALAWDETDPHAVDINFGRGNPWVTDREILAEGLRGPSGVGDLCVRPDPLNPRRCEMLLRSPKGHAVVSFDAVEMAFFLLAIDRELRAAASEGRSDAQREGCSDD